MEEMLLLLWTIPSVSAACVMTSQGLAFVFVTLFRHLSPLGGSSYSAVLFQAIHLNLIIYVEPSLIGCLEMQLLVDGFYLSIRVSLVTLRCDLQYGQNPSRVMQKEWLTVGRVVKPV